MSYLLAINANAMTHLPFELSVALEDEFRSFWTLLSPTPFAGSNQRLSHFISSNADAARVRIDLATIERQTIQFDIKSHTIATEYE